MSYGVGHYIVGGGHYNPHTPPPSCNHAAYTPDSLEAEVSKVWQPIGEIVNVDEDLYSRMETSFRWYTMALQGSDGQLVNNIGDDLRKAFDKVLLIMSGDKFSKSPFGALHERYVKITEKYTTKPQQMGYTGIAAMVTTPSQLQPKK